MKVRVLGCSGAIAKDCRTTSFLIDGELVTLQRPRSAAAATRARTASGSVAVPGQRARVARASRIWVEGRHDAELIERVWGYNYFGSPRTVDVHVRRLREKLGAAARFITTIPCVGYKLIPPGAGLRR